MRVEERFIPGEYLIKAYPDLWFNRRKGFAGFLTNMRLFFGDNQQLHDISLRSVDSLSWGRARRLSIWALLLGEFGALFLAGLPLLWLVVAVALPLLWWFWREDALLMQVGTRRVVIFGQVRALNDIARNIRLHQAVLRSGEAGGALGQRILEAMPMNPQLPPPVGGPLARNYQEQVAREQAPPEGGGAPFPDSGKKKRDWLEVGGADALKVIESQKDPANQSLAARLAYKLWAGRPNPTRLMLGGAHLLLFLALGVFVIADTIAYFNEEAASPFTRLAQLFVLAGLGAFLVVIARKLDNRYRGVEPEQEELIMKLGYKDFPLRVVAHKIAHFFILSSLALTFLLLNFRPFLYGGVFGSLIMTGGRVANLVRMPQWLHRTRPLAKWRLIKLGYNGFRAVVVLVAFSVLAPFFVPHDAALPAAYQNKQADNGWSLEYQNTFTRGLGTVQGGLRVYLDDGRDSEGEPEGYPALLVLITLKEPWGYVGEGVSQKLVEIIDEVMAQQLREQNMEKLERLANLTRTTDQGYTTTYTIYNGTAEGSTYFTEGEQVRLIGEGWYASREKVIVVAVGFAQISTETLDKSPDPPDELPPELREVYDQLPDQLKRIPDIFPEQDPTNTTDTRNWLELYDLIPRVRAW